MYKIMLVEDEGAILNAMTNLLDWNALSFHRPVGCANGKIAIEEIEKGFVPDVVITDICMPFVDGMGVAEYLAENCPKTIVVMLTGYDEFSYAHKALKLKVFDYVLKPITPKSLKALATKLFDELESRRIKDTIAFEEMSVKKFYTKLLTTKMEQSTICENLKAHKIENTKEYWLVMAADLALPIADTTEQSRENELKRYALANIASEVGNDFAAVFETLTIGDNFCVILNGGESQSLMHQAKKLAKQLATACKIIYASSTCGIGNVCNSIEKLNKSYAEAISALDYRFFYGATTYILEENICPPTAQSFDFNSLEQEFTLFVKNANLSGSLEVINKLFVQFQAQRLTYNVCIRYCQRMVISLVLCIGEYISNEEKLKLEAMCDFSKATNALTLPDLHLLLTQICKAAFDFCSMVNMDDATMRVRKAQSYIQENYSDETLSLNTIRDEFNISISYFSKIFKAGTGYTFVEYLTNLRIEKAKELLAHTDKRTGEIASEVGFADPHYFSASFKRITGSTPRDYKLNAKL